MTKLAGGMLRYHNKDALRVSLDSRCFLESADRIAAARVAWRIYNLVLGSGEPSREFPCSPTKAMGNQLQL